MDYDYSIGGESKSTEQIQIKYIGYVSCGSPVLIKMCTLCNGSYRYSYIGIKCKLKMSED
jgi:hypothetical protein